MLRPLAFAAYVFYELRIIDRLIQWKRNHGRKRQPVEVLAEVDSHLRLAQEARQVSASCGAPRRRPKFILQLPD